MELVWTRGRKRVDPPSEELDRLARAVWRGAPAPPAFGEVDGELTLRLRRRDDRWAIGIDVVPLARAILEWPETSRSRQVVSYARRRLGLRFVDAFGPTAYGRRVLGLRNVVMIARASGGEVR